MIPARWSRRGALLVTCPPGLAPYLGRELVESGFRVRREEATAVASDGTLADTLALNLRLRTAHRVLYRLEEGTCRNPDEMYALAGNVPWEDFLHEDGYFTVGGSIKTPSIRDTRFAALKLKDAIVDRIRARAGRRPDSGSDTSRAAVWLYWQGEQAGLYLDTTGEPLARRGYRKTPLRAPMQETLAAACIAASGWTGDVPFVNPMCGSGTLAIEAVGLALNRPAGGLRENFAFMHLKEFPAEHWTRLRSEATAAARPRVSVPIIASDISAHAVEAARDNAARAEAAEWIRFQAVPFAMTEIPPGPGVVMMNPEYGLRMGVPSELRETYRRIGEFLKTRCGGYRGYVFTGSRDLARCIGLKPARRIPFFSGDLECRLLEYELD
jgi:23S rRNA G2445 N2-methylase RlmL